MESTSLEPGEDLDLTMLVIAYDEEGGLRSTVEECLGWLRRHGKRARVIVLDDGSTDRTPQIADELAAEHALVDVFHHPTNVGQHRNIRKGLELVRTTWFTIIPADGQVEISSLDLFLPHIGKYDIIFGFPNNEEERGRSRVILSHLWRLYLLALFNVSVTYLAGLMIAPADLVRRIEPRTDGFLGWYETMTRAVLGGARFIQVPFFIRPRIGGRSKALHPLRNVADALRMLDVWRRIKFLGILPAGRESARLREIYRGYREDSERRQRAAEGASAEV